MNDVSAVCFLLRYALDLVSYRWKFSKNPINCYHNSSYSCEQQWIIFKKINNKWIIASSFFILLYTSHKYLPFTNYTILSFYLFSFSFCLTFSAPMDSSLSLILIRRLLILILILIICYIKLGGPNLLVPSLRHYLLLSLDFHPHFDQMAVLDGAHFLNSLTSSSSVVYLFLGLP